MRIFFRVLVLSVLACVVAAVALGWVAVEVLASAWPDVSVNLDGEVFRWSASDADTMGWWVVGLALVCLVVVVPLILLVGVALPLLLALVLAAFGLALPVLVVAIALAPLWLLLWLLWRALRPAAPQVLTTSARG